VCYLTTLSISEGYVTSVTDEDECAVLEE